jgi:hypothetical protein
MRNDSASIQGAAFHVAGHVVGALAEGNRVVSVQVSRSNPGHGVAYIIYKKNKNPFGDGRVSLESAWRYALERQLGVVRSLLAGPLAEAKCTGKPMRSLGSVSDFERCLRKIEELQPYHEYLCARGGDLTAFNPYEVLNQERKRVRSWLARRKVWACIQYLAEHLMQRECRNENEILRVCSGVPDLDNPDQQSLFMRSAGHKRYENPTRDHDLVQEGACPWIAQENQIAPCPAKWAVP